MQELSRRQSVHALDAGCRRARDPHHPDELDHSTSCIMTRPASGSVQ